MARSYGVNGRTVAPILNHGARCSECPASLSDRCAATERGPLYPLHMSPGGRQNRDVSFGIKTISADGNQTTTSRSNGT